MYVIPERFGGRYLVPMDSKDSRGKSCTSFTREEKDDWYSNDADDELDELEYWSDDELGLDPPQLREEE